MSTAQQNHRTTTSSLRALTQAIEAYIAREQLTRCGFGTAALGDASFPGRLGRGSDVHPGTADKVLAHMNLEAIGPRFLRRVEAFLKVTGIKAHVLGRGALNDPSFVLGLGKGRWPVLGTVDKVSDWMADNASPAELEAVRAAVEDGSPAVPVVAALHEEKREMNDNTGFMKTAQVAAYLGLSPRTLESYRSRGGGPPFYVLGSVVRYLLSDVLKWASTRRRNSTSDDGPGSPVPEDEDKENDGDEDEENDGAEEEDDDRPERPGRSKR